MNKGRMFDNTKLREYVTVNALDNIRERMKALTAQ